MPGTTARASTASATGNKPKTDQKIAPGPRTRRLLGSLSAFQADPLQFLLENAASYGDVVRFQFGPMTGHLVTHPDGVKQILQENNHNYGRDTRGFQALKSTIGDSILTTDGDYWRRQRRIAQPAFHRQRLAGFADLMVSSAQAMVERWKERPEGEIFDVTPELLKVTLRILGLSMFGIDLSDDSEEIASALTIGLEHTTDRARRVFHLPDFIPTPKNRAYKKALATLDRIVLGMIAERRKSKEQKHDLLQMLLETRDEETGETMNDLQLRNELLTMLLAGHETTAMSLTWTFTLLARYPAARRALEAEVDSVLAGRTATLEDLPKLPVSKMVIEESMRILPPVWVVARSVENDDNILGYHIPKGSIVFVSPWVTHRLPSLWSDPEGFDPERFRTDDAARPRYAYFPFGGGPHLCIGQGFAMMEAQLVLATVAQSFRLALNPGHKVEMEPLITLRPKHGVQVIAQRR
jgi:cytochrome P450